VVLELIEFKIELLFLRVVSLIKNALHFNNRDGMLLACLENDGAVVVKLLLIRGFGPVVVRHMITATNPVVLLEAAAGDFVDKEGSGGDKNLILTAVEFINGSTA
jgi:hypothetical protein